MKKMVLFVCACILLVTAQARYLKSTSDEKTLGDVQDEFVRQKDAFTSAGDSNGIPADDVSLATTTELTGDKLPKSINFDGNRGNLPWPVASGIVAIHFGTYTVDGVKGYSDGIYINVLPGDSVRAVADGVIAGVFDIDGSNAVIVKHDKYFTTYNNLENVPLNKGDSIKAGKALGNIITSGTGNSQLLFMINDEKGAPLDPEKWLRRA